MKQITSSILVAVLIFSVQQISAQQQVSSLLSNHGIGTVFNEATVAQKAQGNLSVIDNTNNEVVSIANPALLGDLQLTSFSLSLQSLNAKTETTNNSFENSSLSLTNLSLGFPLGKKGGFSLGLRSHSAIGYEVANENFYNSADGGVNQVYLGLGYKIYKGLSAGVQFNQYFGRTNKKRAAKNTQEVTVLDDKYNVTGNNFKFGLQYQYDLSKKIQVMAGVYGVLAHELNASGTRSFYAAIDEGNNIFQPRRRIITNANGENEFENIAENSAIEGVEENPFKTVVGLGLGKRNKWFAGVSYESKDALSYSGDAFGESIQANFDASQQVTKIGFSDYSKYSIGGYYIPKKYALKNYANKVIYRAGFSYENTGIELNANKVNDIGMTFGLGLPVGRGVSYLNLSIELGKLGDVSKNNYEENYINLGLSFTLSDKWFQKRVID